MKRRPLKRKTPLRKQSKRRQSEYKEYMRKREHFLAMHPICQVWMWQARLDDKCALHIADADFVNAPHSTEIHHRCAGKNRKATYLREDTWMAVSAWGHDFIHMNPKLAYERGWLLKTIPEG